MRCGSEIQSQVEAFFNTKRERKWMKWACKLAWTCESNKRHINWYGKSVKASALALIRRPVGNSLRAAFEHGTAAVSLFKWNRKLFSKDEENPPILSEHYVAWMEFEYTFNFVYSRPPTLCTPIHPTTAAVPHQYAMERKPSVRLFFAKCLD